MTYKQLQAMEPHRDNFDFDEEFVDAWNYWDYQMYMKEEEMKEGKHNE